MNEQEFLVVSDRLADLKVNKGPGSNSIWYDNHDRHEATKEECKITSEVLQSSRTTLGGREAKH